MTGTIYTNGGGGKFKDAMGELKLMGSIVAEGLAEFDTNVWIMY